MTEAECEEIRRTLRDAWQNKIDPVDLAKRAERARRIDRTLARPERLIGDTLEVVTRLRRQAESGGNSEREWDVQEKTWVAPERVSTGAKPGSRAPLELGAIDQADAEVVELVRLADLWGIPVYGPLWRVNGEVRGIAGGDLSEVRRLSGVLRGLESWGMLDCADFGEWEKVRGDSLRMVPGLDTRLRSDLVFGYGETADAEIAAERGEFGLFG